MKLYGSLTNRLEEGRQYCDEIVVGTGVTEYHWSDRDAYEVVAVRDQKHVTVRELDHRHVGDGVMDNNWELVSNENNPTRELERRGDVWYWSSTLTADDIAGIDDDSISTRFGRRENRRNAARRTSRSAWLSTTTITSSDGGAK